MPFFSNATVQTGFSAHHAASLYHTVPAVHTAYPTLHTTVYPVKEPQYTTVYETILPAACETSQWLATYTITETCIGKPTDYVTPTMPPGFVVTTVACHACKPATEIEITCPGAQPTGTWVPTVSITGNGVTATITAYPTSTPTTHTRTVPAVPTHTVVGSCSGPGPCPGSGSGTGSGSGSGSGSGTGSGPSCHGPSCVSPGSVSGPVGGSGTGSGCTGPSCVSSGCNGSGGRCNASGMASNGTTSSPPAVVTAGAASLKNAFAVFSGLAFVAGHFLIL
ncbi:uncharacterized protein GGS22DRAFT_168432 [Annulohypoxylon maeteangense]|uniref:uncharacterized protein n=1 Tax=Annulohypoxylon maeteangense TaxID=1927788 RepID=UPI00200756AD|nr:uncharacterized protein GGS22DRAFT_168432 [Annulohypoxylon maeteangense]KAI0883328.1 hypothetical protein GGS22DRAFT_168432 [Annulohypoxylon maeteangense]